MGNPLNLGELTVTSDGTQLAASAQFGDGTAAGSILIMDTRSGDENWTASASATDLTSGSGSINGENLGLIDLNVIPIPGNALNASNIELTDIPGPPLAVAPLDAGLWGLKGGPHPFANSTEGGDGSVGIGGTITVVAPTSTPPGTYLGTITFTVV
jgi:hypothetical protein